MLCIAAPVARAAEADISKLPPPATTTVDFVKDIQPILAKNCYSCHEQNGAVDTTFVQFYPTLIDAAKKIGADAKDQRAVKKYRDMLITESLKVRYFGCRFRSRSMRESFCLVRCTTKFEGRHWRP